MPAHALACHTLLEYNAFGQVTSEYQEHSGAVNTSTTLKVGYAYATGASNHVRRTQTVYPNGRILHSGYDSGLDDVLCRVSYLADDNGSGSPGQHLAEYDYLGASPRSQGGRGAGGEGIVRVTYPQPGIRWGLLGAGGGNDPYARMDRFGRVTEQVWRRCTAPAADLVRIQHAYDLAGNRLWRRDRVASAAGKALDELYSYDGMNQLVALQRGRLNAARDALRDSTRTFGESWSLDMTGNWRGYDQDADGDGTPDLAQTRTHNVVNEITAITGGSWATPAHDRAGNMTSLPKPSAPTTAFTCTYDAWNRLVEVKDGTVTVGRYEYDGLNRRIVRRYDSRSPGSPQGIDRHEHCYYNSAWQLLETRETTSSTALPQDVQPKHQYVWSLTYIDTPVLRDENTDSDGLCDDGRCYYLHDANMNVVALTSTAGAVVERYAYDAYGKTTIYDGTWSSTRSVSSYGNAITYTGRQYDPETGFLYFRQRYLTSPLGRFLSRDPIGYRARGWSLYRCVGSNPMRYVDPSGLADIPTGWESEGLPSPYDQTHGKWGRCHPDDCCPELAAKMFKWWNDARLRWQQLNDDPLGLRKRGSPDFNPQAWNNHVDQLAEARKQAIRCYLYYEAKCDPPVRKPSFTRMPQKMPVPVHPTLPQGAFDLNPLWWLWLLLFPKGEGATVPVPQLGVPATSPITPPIFVIPDFLLPSHELDPV